LLLAYAAERIDRLINYMIATGKSRPAIFGSRAHTAWLYRNINGLRHTPIAALVHRPDRAGEFADLGVPVYAIDDPLLAERCDAVLISDDRCEMALAELAERHLPPGTTIWRLYHRMPIGAEELGGPRAVATSGAAPAAAPGAAPHPLATTIAEAKPGATEATPTPAASVTPDPRSRAAASAEPRRAAGGRLSHLVVPV
jgi:hypothetical protein